MATLVKAVRAVWAQSQAPAVFAICIGTGMVLPLSLLSLGFHAL